MISSILICLVIALANAIPSLQPAFGAIWFNNFLLGINCNTSSIDFLSKAFLQSKVSYFEIFPTNNGNTGSSVTLHYFDGELNSILESDLSMFRNISGKWAFNGFTSRDFIC